MLRDALLGLVLLLAGAQALAHEMTLAELQVREVSRGEFVWQWLASSDRIGATGLTLLWPEPCKADANLVSCGDGSMRGTLTVEGVGERYSAALVRIHWLDGGSSIYTFTANQRSAQLFGSAEDRRSMGEIGWAYLELGVKHILTGIDHLLFVIGLLFLVGFRRQLIWTITAFTVAHSITLGLSGLGLLVLRPPPVEAAIALSIVLVAAEGLHKQPTLSRRWPSLVAFLFGLVHGLGFAGVLKQIGLPENHMFVALLTFNLGVEIGQLLTVAAAWAVCRMLAPWPQLERARTPALYAMGGMAAFWAIGRVAKILVP